MKPSGTFLLTLREHGESGPLQINTHSPAVVMQVPEESLLVAEMADGVHNGRPSRGLRLRGLQNTWRDKAGHSEVIAKGQLLAYLNPVSLDVENGEVDSLNKARDRRVIDREDIRQYKIPFVEIAE